MTRINPGSRYGEERPGMWMMPMLPLVGAKEQAARQERIGTDKGIDGEAVAAVLQPHG